MTDISGSPYTRGELRQENKRLQTENASLRAVLKAYEEFEADLILNGDWSGECVRMTQAQHDRMMELQAMRNEALGKREV
jgi:hypothetical protein